MFNCPSCRVLFLGDSRSVCPTCGNDLSRRWRPYQKTVRSNEEKALIRAAQERRERQKLARQNKEQAQKLKDCQDAVRGFSGNF